VRLPRKIESSRLMRAVAERAEAERALLFRTFDVER
jgi:hypothetical protein